MSLKDKTLFISGASRGIGLAIALRAARDGANIAVAAKTAAPHPKLEGTIYAEDGLVSDRLLVLRDVPIQGRHRQFATRRVYMHKEDAT